MGPARRKRKTGTSYRDHNQNRLAHTACSNGHTNRLKGANQWVSCGQPIGPSLPLVTAHRESGGFFCKSSISAALINWRSCEPNRLMHSSWPRCVPQALLIETVWVRKRQHFEREPERGGWPTSLRGRPQ
ncbi:uncharacterized protein YALI1_F35549g [Yarrowia lipolytica]|uniref:Uncharacterized protein n=1 Tax=Yarrowia lipolytica TaxID=4952 RepID=A0A1D8NQ92_YARLL|nr:hypothetical protein YALI1_F35549g [Yarrowia lipolytica]